MQNDNDYMENDDTVPHMKSLSSCLNRMVLEGYTEDFKISDAGLKSLGTNNIYQPDQITVKNFYRFEGQSDPNDNTIMYVIETNDGVKGTMVDAYGAYADVKLSEFMNQVEDFQKKIKNSVV